MFKQLSNLATFTFSPYTKQPTTILIFKKGGKTKSVWFFEVTDDGFGNTDKRKPVEENDLPLLRSLWNDKVNQSKSFTIDYKDIEKDSYKLFLNYYKKKKKVKNAIELGKLCDFFVVGHTPSKSRSDFYSGKSGGIWATIGDMKERTVTDSQMKLSKLGIEQIGNGKKNKSRNIANVVQVNIRKTAFAGKDLFTNEAICALMLKDEYNTDEIKEYLYHVLPLIDYTPYAQRAAKGLNIK